MRRNGLSRFFILIGFICLLAAGGLYMWNVEESNRAGEAAGERYGVKYLHADFKKKNGYLRSLQLSAEYELYRQNYCGCLYSRGDR